MGEMGKNSASGFQLLHNTQRTFNIQVIDVGGVTQGIDYQYIHFRQKLH